MRKFIKPQRNQLLMLQTVDLNSIALPGSALHSIDTIVESLDTSAFEAVYDLESSRGNCPIAPKTIIKVCLYALHSGRFSTRKMEYDTGHHLGYMFLTGAQRIDHSTFSKFLSKFKTEVVALFSQIVLVCVEQGLVDFKVLCIDSVKLRANASHKQQKNRKGLEKAAVKLRKRIAGLLDNVSSEETEVEQEQELRRLEKRLADLDAARDRCLGSTCSLQSRKIFLRALNYKNSLHYPFQINSLIAKWLFYFPNIPNIPKKTILGLATVLKMFLF